MESLNINRHISGQCNSELESVRNQVMQMGGLVYGSADLTYDTNTLFTTPCRNRSKTTLSYIMVNNIFTIFVYITMQLQGITNGIFKY